MGNDKFNAEAGRGNPAMEQHPIQLGVEILLVTSQYRNQKLLGFYVDFSQCDAFQKISIPVLRRVTGNSKGEGASKFIRFRGKYEPKLEFPEG